jgi:WD40 repeat protein
LVGGGAKVTFYDPGSGNILNEEALPGPLTVPFSFSKDGKILAFTQRPSPAGKDTLLVMDVLNQKTLFKSQTKPVDALALSQDGKTLVYSADKTLLFHDLTSGKTEEGPKGEKAAYKSLKFSPDGNFLVGIEGTFLVFISVKTLTVSGKQSIGGGGPLDISSDGKFAVVNGKKGGNPAFYAFSLLDLQLQYLEQNLAASPNLVALSPNGNYLAVYMNGLRTVQIWDLNQKKAVATWLPVESNTTLTAMAFSPDGKTLVTGATNKVHKLWDLTSLAAGAGDP